MMPDTYSAFDPDLADLTKAVWMAHMQKIGQDHGFFRQLGKRHFATHIRRGDTLLVSFETVQDMRGLSALCEPMGWRMVRENGWSHLCMVGDGNTWFRDRDVFEFFDDMTDEGFFDAFETVVFYGAGPCGYAAAAFSVAAPGARVITVQPQATLDPRVTAWDDRYCEMRRTSFTDRYGYAPDMLDACDQAFVLYDPLESLDAAHAALFTRPGVTQLRMRHMGDAIQSDLMAMNLFAPLLVHVAEDRLDGTSFARLYRARRTHPPYLRRVMAALEFEERDGLVYMMARNVTRRMKAPRFERRLAEIDAARAIASEG